MPGEQLVVIGGVAAGMSAASRARRINPRLKIVVLEKGATVSYSACGLPFLLSGEVARPGDLIVFTPEQLRQQRNLDVRTHHEAVEIMPGKKQVRVRAGDSEELLPYDNLILTAGAAPAQAIEGAHLPGVFNCNSLAAATALLGFIEDRRPQQTVIIGSGYIGLEVAEALRRRGLTVTILERSGHLLESLEPKIAELVAARLADNGVQVSYHTPVRAIDLGPREGRLTVLHGERNTLETELVLLATGLLPRVEMAVAAGVETGPTGAIRTDDRQQTNVPGIYAAGDCTETLHRVSNRPAYMPLGTTANKQGRVAGENAAGGHARFPGIVGTLVTKVFGLEIAKTGLSVVEARAAGFRPETVTVDSFSRARYLGGKPVRVTLVLDRESGRLLGGQLTGEEGAARRVDVVATALTAGMLLKDFVHLDLGYAPPFGPVYDPLLVAAWQGLKKLGQRR